jgi:hypothetical protein
MNSIAQISPLNFLSRKETGFICTRSVAELALCSFKFSDKSEAMFREGEIVMDAQEGERNLQTWVDRVVP